MEQGKIQMKRKILVLLLALTLALSLTPMMAFADDGTEDPASANETANEIAEENKAQDEVPVKADSASDSETAKEKDHEEVLARKARATMLAGGNKTVLKSSRKAAVKRGPKLCPHTHTFNEYWYDEEECIKRDLGDNHEVTGEIWKATICEQCLETLGEVYLGYTTVTERHYYEWGKCWICEHKNTCSHPSTGAYYNPDEDEDCKIIDRGDYHELNGCIDQITYCTVCQDLLDLEVFEYMTVNVDHFFNSGGACEECGHLNDDTRLYGQSRYDTAVTVGNRYSKLSGSKFKNVIVAYGQNYPDALSGGYLAKVKNAPILLVKPAEEDYIANYIDENIASEGKVYILGGTGAVSASFENKIKARGIDAVRLGGEDRYATNLEILKAAEVDNEEILVCTGASFPDSLSASAAKRPILLVGSSLTDAQKEYIQGLSTEKFYLIGGEGAVVPEIESDLIDLGYSRSNIKRVAGSTRFETSTAVADEFFNSPQTVVLAYAQNFPDGLSGGPFAMLLDAPIILTNSSKTEAARAYVRSVGATDNYTLGGPSLISDRAVDVIMGD